jgi:undecaprenyl-diphosphatase
MDFLEALDQGALPWFQIQRRPWLDAVALALLGLGSPPALAAVTLLAAGSLALRRCWRRAGLVLAVAAAATLLAVGLAALTRRPPPDVLQPIRPAPAVSSFPSAAALVSAAVYGTTVILAGGRWRPLLAPIAVAVPFAIGVSQLYAGTHYITDVEAGWLGGLLCVLTALWLDERIAPAAGQARSS